MKKNIAALIAGLLFGLGLAISQMTNPAKVLNFLDITGTWDPTLAFVMGGAVLVTLISFRFILKQDRPLFEGQFHLPTRSDIDGRLLGGAALFGIGWGLAGYCPGPGIAALVMFVLAGTAKLEPKSAVVKNMLWSCLPVSAIVCDLLSERFPDVR